MCGREFCLHAIPILELNTNFIGGLWPLDASCFAGCSFFELGINSILGARQSCWVSLTLNLELCPTCPKLYFFISLPKFRNNEDYESRKQNHRSLKDMTLVFKITTFLGSNANYHTIHWDQNHEIMAFLISDYENTILMSAITGFDHICF